MTSNVEEGAAGYGALARILATRSGRAAPEAPIVIEHREALSYLLSEAVELEHAIMCQYLFADFSLKQSRDRGITEQQLWAVDRWRKTISDIAAREMLQESEIVPRLRDFAAVGHFYRSIEQSIKQLCAKYGQRSRFVGPVEAQASESRSRGPPCGYPGKGERSSSAAADAKHWTPHWNPEPVMLTGRRRLNRRCMLR